jgi:predicted nucleic acid-binding protein
MSGKAFFDTNILVYTFDARDPRKQSVARSLIAEALDNGDAVISYQIVQEFVNVARRKLEKPLRSEDLVFYLRTTLRSMLKISFSLALCESALALSDSLMLSWYDSLIVAAALEAGCTKLYTEDMQHQQVIEGLTIVNPFA